MEYGEWGIRFHEWEWIWVEITVANGCLPLGYFSWRVFLILVSGERYTAQIPHRAYTVSAVWSAHLSIQGSAPRTKSRASAQASVSSWQNRASCVQDNVLKWLIKGFLDITSPCKAIFWWLNCKWIRNIWSEFPLGFTKYTLDFFFVQNIWKIVLSVCWIEYGFTFPSSPFMLWQFRKRTKISQSFFFCLSLCSWVTRSLYKCRVSSSKSFSWLSRE